MIIGNMNIRHKDWLIISKIQKLYRSKMNWSGVKIPESNVESSIKIWWYLMFLWIGWYFCFINNFNLCWLKIGRLKFCHHWSWCSVSARLGQLDYYRILHRPVKVTGPGWFTDSWDDCSYENHLDWPFFSGNFKQLKVKRYVIHWKTPLIWNIRCINI